MRPRKPVPRGQALVVNPDLPETEVPPIVGVERHRLVRPTIAERRRLLDLGPIDDGGMSVWHVFLRGWVGATL
jgi:hypothetical protein